MIFVRSWPAAPTNGSPCASSSAPGASPTNIIAALMSPTPNTTFLREAARFGHFIQTRARSRSALIASALARGSSWVDAEAGVATNGFAKTGEDEGSIAARSDVMLEAETGNGRG